MDEIAEKGFAAHWKYKEKIKTAYMEYKSQSREKKTKKDGNIKKNKIQGKKAHLRIKN